MTILEMFGIKPSIPSDPMKELIQLRDERSMLIAELDALNKQIEALERTLNTQPHTQLPEITKQDNLAYINNTNPLNPMAIAAPIDTNVNNNLPISVPPKQKPKINAESIISHRAPYHTEEIQILSMNKYAEAVMYRHYLQGDGITSGVKSPSDCEITHHTSESGKKYRLMTVPALKITCTLKDPLPSTFKEKRMAIDKWLKANDWLTGTDKSKEQFHTDLNKQGFIYSPYVYVDSKGNHLWVYIGCEDVECTKPAPSLIA